ncbi:AraC family transcriptional regulator [Caballeronia catudaia]|uniref:AraC family transcriptional regulator n=1 Tax=Caballeronia catudaia TaxID=1777136 RepID=A0A158CI40_9BURK|nr:AraC family transcriptional regulator [Caballeronia catudaia]SAK81985.1 AraC family transcriptional regulator [Caballeronia catudaia]
MTNQPAMTDVRTITPDGGRVRWQPPAKWRRRLVASSLSAVSVEHCIAGASEVPNLEATGPILAMYLRIPTALELRMDGGGWASKRLRTPLIYVPAGFSCSSRWTDKAEWLTVHFESSWLDRSGLLTENQPVSIGPRFDVSDELLTQIVRSLHEDALAGMPMGPLYAESLGAAALRRMVYLESRRRPTEYTHAAIMQKAADYIQDNLEDELTLLTVANAVDYPGDLYSFIRSFKKAHGMTPHQYIIESRLHAARKLIVSGQCDITEAALSCGFSTASHFSATFRKRWGVSPSKFKPASANFMREEARESTGR